jgi:hypothetical protein
LASQFLTEEAGTRYPEQFFDLSVDVACPHRLTGGDQDALDGFRHQAAPELPVPAS